MSSVTTKYYKKNRNNNETFSNGVCVFKVEMFFYERIAIAASSKA